MATTATAKSKPVVLPQSAITADRNLRAKLKTTETKLAADVRDDRYALGRLRFFWCNIKGVTQAAYASKVGGVTASAVGQSITNFRKAFPDESAKALAQPEGDGVVKSPRQVAATERERKAEAKRAQKSGASKRPQLDNKARAKVERKLEPFGVRIDSLVVEIYKTLSSLVELRDHADAVAEVRRFVTESIDSLSPVALESDRKVA